MARAGQSRLPSRKCAAPTRRVEDLQGWGHFHCPSRAYCWRCSVPLGVTEEATPSCMFLGVQHRGSGSLGHCGLTWGDLCPEHAMQSMAGGDGPMWAGESSLVELAPSFCSF